MKMIPMILVMSFLLLFWSIPVYLLSKKDSFQLNLKPEDKKNLFIPHSQIELKFSPMKFLNNISSKRYNKFSNFMKCQDYEEWIMDESVKKLGTVFNINIEFIHELISKIIIILFLIIIVCFVEISIIIFFSSFVSIISTIMLLFGIVKLGAMITSFIFYVILLYSSGVRYMIDYRNFLECPNVNVKAFDKFGNITALYIFLLILVCVYMIDIALFVLYLGYTNGRNDFF